MVRGKSFDIAVLYVCRVFSVSRCWTEVVDESADLMQDPVNTDGRLDPAGVVVGRGREVEGEGRVR